VSFVTGGKILWESGFWDPITTRMFKLSWTPGLLLFSLELLGVTQKRIVNFWRSDSYNGFGRQGIGTRDHGGFSIEQIKESVFLPARATHGFCHITKRHVERGP
jgi:hypothetical protein